MYVRTTFHWKVQVYIISDCTSFLDNGNLLIPISCWVWHFLFWQLCAFWVKRRMLDLKRLSEVQNLWTGLSWFWIAVSFGDPLIDHADKALLSIGSIVFQYSQQFCGNCVNWLKAAVCLTCISKFNTISRKNRRKWQWKSRESIHYTYLRIR